MYENMNDNNHNNSKNQFSPVKKSAAMTSSLVSKSNNDFLVENFL